MNKETAEATVAPVVEAELTEAVVSDTNATTVAPTAEPEIEIDATS